jgi:Protein of unknown function (DUF4242)
VKEDLLWIRTASLNKHIINRLYMPKFLDVHSMKGVDEETIRKAQKMPKDEFGITHDNMMFNREEDRWYCLLDAPSKEAVEKHHQKAGISCEYITEVKTTA